MGLFDRFRRRNTQAATESMPQRNTRVSASETVVVGAGNEKDEVQIQSFSNSNITFNGNLAGYDYSSILRDKQANIISLYQ